MGGARAGRAPPRSANGLYPGGSLSGGSLSRGVSVMETPWDRDPLPVWYRVGGTHPTGMHSCLISVYVCGFCVSVNIGSIQICVCKCLSDLWVFKFIQVIYLLCLFVFNRWENLGMEWQNDWFETQTDWEVPAPIHSSSAAWKSTELLGLVSKRVFWMAQVPLAFEFECNRPNGNSTTFCHQICKSATWQFRDKQLLNGHLAGKAKLKRKRNMRYFKFTSKQA